ncbi:PstS family phosphate ABC transporter substrate-binding protein [Microlunatus sp. GCM10028923]|uniref:PstS family phosphate ABC transporter substrate-binding protein n=1 Tax=Microlunatus sp. GCM10028923 TaxID=3273400 RepID=UPI003612468D
MAGAALAASSIVLSGCGGQSNTTGNPGGEGGVSGTVAIDGSSTVAPLSEAAADLFRAEQPGVNVTVATSGTGGGFKKFCAGETDISDASRAIKDEEVAACKQAGIEFTEIVIANDGLSVVVNPENDWAKCLTVKQLQTMWSPESEGKINNWKQIDPSFPDQPLTLFGAGTDSGTFDYFTEAINGEEGATRTDYSPSEDDNVTIQGVQGDKGAVGYFGLSYVEENPGAIKAVEVDGGKGCVAPTSDTVQDGSYQPLGRSLFIYVNNAHYKDKAELRAFIDFYVENEAKIAEEALFIGLTPEQKQTAKSELESLLK